MCVKKLEIDGKVAVLISPNYGAGWSTWADDKHKLFMLFDYDLATAVLKGDYSKAVQLVLEHDPTIYVGGAQDLKVVLVKKGTEFRIEEYDGFESIVTNHDNYWIQA
jgi:hypothetical protein